MLLAVSHNYVFVWFGFSRTEEQTDTAKLNGMASDGDAKNFRSAEGKRASGLGHSWSKLIQGTKPDCRKSHRCQGLIFSDEPY